MHASWRASLFFVPIVAVCWLALSMDLGLAWTLKLIRIGHNRRWVTQALGQSDVRQARYKSFVERTACPPVRRGVYWALNSNTTVGYEGRSMLNFCKRISGWNQNRARGISTFCAFAIVAAGASITRGQIATSLVNEGDPVDSNGFPGDNIGTNNNVAVNSICG